MKLPAILSFLCVSVLGLSAQSVPGSWTILPMQGTAITDITETPSTVFYISAHDSRYGFDNALYIYDKESGENSYAAPGSTISDGGVAYLKYNKAGKYTACAYTNGNIDLIYDSGKIVNMPEIKESRVTGSKAINDISFGDGRMYVATDFGIVIYDDKNHVVKESGIYNTPVQKIARMGDKLLIYGFLDESNPSLKVLLEAPVDGRHNTLSRFSLLRSNIGITDWIIPGDNFYITLDNAGGNYSAVRVDIADGGNFSFTNIAAVPGASQFKICDSGYYCAGSDRIVFFDEEGNLSSTKMVDRGGLQGPAALWNSSMKSVWCATGNSIGNYDFSSGMPRTLSGPFEAEGAKTFNNAFVVNSPDGSRAYINGVGQSEYHPLGNPDRGMETPYLLASYDWESGTITNEYPEVKEQFSSVSQAEYNTYKVDALYGGPTRTLVDPVDPTLIYHANHYDGLMLIRDREVVFRFHDKNSPLFTRGGVARVNDLAFDSMGNLWVGLWRGTTSSSTSSSGVYKVLTKDKLELARTNPEALTEKDGTGQYKHWQQPAWVESDNGKCDIHLAFSGNKGLKVDGSWNDQLVGIDTKGTPEVSDDSYIRYTGYTDQDGTTTNPSMQGCIAVDRSGWFWIGTNAGIYIVKDISQIGQSSGTLSAVRPKVARDDGTDYADYLLSSEKIYCIEVDANNNKWIATSNSGLYYVNSDGTKILGRFDKSNTPMRTNEVTTVICNPYGNDVLVGSREGLYVYGSTTSPAAEDYSDVKVYPNPVRPEYGGWVTIEGLMGDSLVKIADASGNVVWSGQSEGGTCSWDGCDAAGNRVHSGVYMIFASQNSDGSSSGAVAKIVVIN